MLTCLRHLFKLKNNRFCFITQDHGFIKTFFKDELSNPSLALVSWNQLSLPKDFYDDLVLIEPKFKEEQLGLFYNWAYLALKENNGRLTIYSKYNLDYDLKIKHHEQARAIGFQTPVFLQEPNQVLILARRGL